MIFSTRSFRGAAISALTRVFDALWRRTRDPDNASECRTGFRVHALTRVPRNDGWIEMAKNTKTKSKKTRKVDPVIAEIVRNGVLAVTEEMKTNLMRTAYNMIIYEALDFTTGLFTPEGETRTVAELGEEWKKRHSHRARASAALADAVAGHRSRR